MLGHPGTQGFSIPLDGEGKGGGDDGVGGHSVKRKLIFLWAEESASPGFWPFQSIQR